MATLKNIRAAIKTILEANIAGLHVYKRMPGSADTLPCVVVLPGSEGPEATFADFNVAMGRGTDTWFFQLYMFVSGADLDVAQDSLDDYLTGAGVKSIRAALFSNRTLGLSGTDAHLAGWSSYSQRYEMDVKPIFISSQVRLVSGW